MKILIANPRGFCAGVVRAIKIVENALKIYGPPIYVRHEIVHNRFVIEDLKRRGVKFIENLNEVPSKSILIFSAHGVSQNEIEKAKKLNLIKLFDATCPLVKKIHLSVKKESKNGKEIILIGHFGHPEVLGTMGQYDNKNSGIYLVTSVEDVNKLKVKNKNNLCFMTQTTLSIEDTSDIIIQLNQRFPKIVGPHKSDICYATINRQNAVNILIKDVDIVLVVGSKNSSNSNRLVEIVKRKGKNSYLIDSYEDIKEEWLHNIKCIGVTAGASAPEFIVQNVLNHLFLLKNGNINIVEMQGDKEKIKFKIPIDLQIK